MPRSLPPDSTPTLDEIPGPMDARFLSSVGLGFGTRIGRAQLFPTPVLDKNRLPTKAPLTIRTEIWACITFSELQAHPNLHSPRLSRAKRHRSTHPNL